LLHSLLGSNSAGGGGMLSSILVFYYSIIVSGGDWGGGMEGRKEGQVRCKVIRCALGVLEISCVAGQWF
jgi:hypothetical protein